MPIGEGWYLSQRSPITRMKPRLLKPSMGQRPAMQWHSVILRPSMWLPWERWRPPTQLPLEKQRPHVLPLWGKQKLQGQHKPPSYDRPTWKPCELWKMRPWKALLPILPAGLWSGSSGLPNEALGILMYTIHLLTGNMSLSGLLTATPQQTIGSRDPIISPSHPRRPTTVTHPTGNKWQHLPRHEVELDHSGDGDPASHPRKPPQWRRREEDPLAEHLRGGKAPIGKPSART